MPVKIAMAGRILLFWFLVTIVVVGCTDFSFYSLLDGDAGGGDTGEPLAIAPQSPIFLNVGQETSITVTGGTPPYSFDVVEGDGKITSEANIGTYTAPSNPTNDRVKVVDNVGNEIEVLIVVQE